MSEQVKLQTPRLQAWLAEWPSVRSEIESILAEYSQRDPSLHFEITLAQLELKDLDEAAKRVGALGRLLRGGDLTAAEMEATGNT
jgi:hypothetical protein